MTEHQRIRVLIVDDQPVVRQGLETFLLSMPDMEVVGLASDGQQAVDLYQREQVDVVLMDLVMPQMDGVQAIESICALDSRARIVVLTSFQEDDRVQRALEVGAAGYLLKSSTAAELGEALRSAYAGRHPLSAEATAALIRASRREPRVGEDLTEREREVLAWIARGASNQEIAEALVISAATAKFHVGNILSKLEAANRAEAVAIAIKSGLVEDEL